jgi:hypothetical protein
VKYIEAMFVGLLICLLACVANAERYHLILDPSMKVTIQDQNGAIDLKLSEEHWIVPRSDIDAARACCRKSTRLESDLVACITDNARLSSPTPQWKSALRWSAVGAAVVGAFVLGMAVNK